MSASNSASNSYSNSTSPFYAPVEAAEETEGAEGEGTNSPTAKSWRNELLDSFHSLAGSPRELYLCFLLKTFESYNYFALSQILVIYLHTEYGLSDVVAGTVYGTWGLSITLWGLSTAFLNDKMGVRRSLIIGCTVSAVSSLMIATTTSLDLLYANLFFLLPLGNSMGMPMLTIAIKRYTNTKNRGFAFGLFYSCMNIGALISGVVVDLFNVYLGWPKDAAFTANRGVILTTTLLYCCSMVITYG